jgi:AraC-like ligand binding domain
MTRTAGVSELADPETARLFRVPGLAGVEVLHARFVTYRYAPHFHEAVTIAVVDRGAAGFTSGRRRYYAGARSLFVIPALEVHTGEVAAAGGYTYRVLYVDPGLLEELLREVGPRSVPPAPPSPPRWSALARPRWQRWRRRTRPLLARQRRWSAVMPCSAVWRGWSLS